MNNRKAAMRDRMRIVESTNQRFRTELSFPDPDQQELTGGGKRWTKITIDGLADGSGRAGWPGVPVFRTLIAVPKGAVAYIVHARPTLGRKIHLNLYPYQPLRDEISTEIDRFHERPPHRLYAQQPFVKDDAAYQGRGRFPRTLANMTPLGRVRDMQVALLECAAGQFTPHRGILQLFESVDVEVGFRGGTGTFGTRQGKSPFETGVADYPSVANYAVLADHLDDSIPKLKCLGEELLILTHPNYRDAAEKLAQWRNDHGIATSVFNVNDGSGSGPNTKEEIRAFIQNRFNTCVVRPSYILLLGDVPEIPTWVMQRLIKPPGVMIATDFPYSTLDPDPEAKVALPSFALGRIPVTSLDQAMMVIEKMIAYEGNPPPFDPAFHHISVASYFQCCRTDVAMPGVENSRAFILNAEFMRNSLMELGYDVQRIYDTSTAYPEDPPYSGDVTPHYFANGTPLPSDLGPGSGFAWNGNAQNVVAAINQGRIMVFHIDHGYTGGWGDPPFGSGNVPSLTNTFSPVIFDLDCSSGNFESTCFAEVVLQPANSGAIGAYGWTRMSNTYYYRSLLEGTLNALWPNSFPEFGIGPGIEKRRLGDLLIHSKCWMVQRTMGTDPQDPAYDNAINHARLYHLFGDPTLAVWTQNPFKLPLYFEFIPQPNWWEIHHPEEGAIITALQRRSDGSILPIGRSRVKNGVARLDHLQTPVKGPVYVSAAKTNGVAAVLGAVEV
jgi:hypothetical protein